MLTARKKKIIINANATHDKDTGSTAVQIAILSRRIEDLTGHLKKNVKDNISRRGLLKMVGQRRRLLAYLQKTDEKGYVALIKKLGLKK